jgi:RNA polymerase sigma-70 factor, ECF subfamily
MMEDIHARGSEAGMRHRFEEAILPHLDRAYNLARWLMQNPHDAEDCVQEAFIRAYKAFPRFREGDGKAWIMTIVRNACYSRIRQTQGRPDFEPLDEELPAPAKEGPLFGEIDTEMLHEAMRKLAPEFREMIVLHDIEGLSYKEMAAVSGVPIGTVMSRLARGRDRLRGEILALMKGGPR